MQQGSDDVMVGVPIMVTVEEEEDIPAFADFVLDEAPAAAAAAPVTEPEPVVEAAAATPPAPAEPAPVAATPVAPVVVAEEPPKMESMAAAIAPVMSTGWGEFAKVNSPILKTLSKQQKDYVEKYGTTGQTPL